MDNIQDILEAVNVQLGEFAQSDSVVGSPQKIGAVTVYPISRISVALGAGGGEGEDPSGSEERKTQGPESGNGGGSGGAARARPVAVLVFSPEGVSVLPVPDRKGKFDQIFDKIPDLIERFKDR
jgi:uncharacterized spore protein YtfJ